MVDETPKNEETADDSAKVPAQRDEEQRGGTGGSSVKVPLSKKLRKKLERLKREDPNIYPLF